MKSHFKIFPLFLSIVVIIVFFFQFSFTSFAIDREGDKIVIHDFHDLLELGVTTIGFAYSQCKSIYDGNFTQYISNDETFKNLWTEDNVIVDESTQTITFSEDLTAYMKQALIEYAQETNGFTLVSTVDFRTITGSEFPNAYIYYTLRDLLKESGNIIGFNYYYSASNSYVIYTDFSDFNSKNGEFVYYTGGSALSPVGRMAVYDSLSFKTIDLVSYIFNANSLVTSYDTWEGLSESPFLNNTYGYWQFKFAPYYRSYGFDMNRGRNGSAYPFIITGTGERIRVYNSVAALQNSVTNTRSVYFGSGFYDDPGEIQVSFDDLEKYIDGKYDSFFDDLKDLIGDNEDNLTEEDLEKLVDQILNKMDDIGGGNQGGSGSDDSSIWDGISDIFEGMTSTISGYLNAILMYLESILTDLDYIVLELQDMTEEEVNTKSDSVISELSDAFSEIGDVMSQKFPFSIPWDIKNLYVALSGGKEPGIQSLSDDIGISGLYHDNSPPSASSGKLIDVIVYPSPDDGVVPLVADEDMGNITPVLPSGDASFTDSGAPVFKIPFVIRSAGVNAAVLLDMSYFDTVSAFSRTLFLLIFLHQLFLLSMRVFEFVKSFMG